MRKQQNKDIAWNLDPLIIGDIQYQSRVACVAVRDSRTYSLLLPSPIFHFFFNFPLYVLVASHDNEQLISLKLRILFTSKSHVTMSTIYLMIIQ